MKWSRCAAAMLLALLAPCCSGKSPDRDPPSSNMLAWQTCRPEWSTGDHWEVLYGITELSPRPDGRPIKSFRSWTTTYRVTSNVMVDTGPSYDPAPRTVTTLSGDDGEVSLFRYDPSTLRLVGEPGGEWHPTHIVHVPAFPENNEGSEVVRSARSAPDRLPGSVVVEFAADRAAGIARFELTETLILEGRELAGMHMVQYWRPGAKCWFYARQEYNGYVLEGWLHDGS